MDVKSIPNNFTSGTSSNCPKYTTKRNKKSSYSRTININVSRKMFLPLLLFVSTIILNHVAAYDICYDKELKTYMACSPGLFDIIADRGIQVTVDPVDATCGTPASTNTRLGDRSNKEFTCDASSNDLMHPPNYIVDDDEVSWWQSVSLTKPNRDLPITIDLAFGKMFRLAGRLVITLNYARPEMMVLERSVDMGQTWTPLQYFARYCSDFTNATIDAAFSKENPTAVVCNNRNVQTSSRIRQGQRVIYDLDERFALFWGPVGNDLASLYTNLQTKMLDDLLFTNIRIRLVRPYIDGGDYDKFFYAIQDMNVLARCFCNLHGQNCTSEQGAIRCTCEHNTEGINCERCKPLYNERPWLRGSYIPYPSGTANECTMCECNAHAELCTYNATYGRGICDTCLHDTQGNHCEDCQAGFYPNVSRSLDDEDRCVDCLCNALGVEAGNTVCNRDLNSNISPGQCLCKSLVTSLRCDRCIPSYYGLMLDPQGECNVCECNLDGTTGQSNTCAEEDGQCPCKASTTGRQCNGCADTFYNFPTGNPQGECTHCGCNPGGSLSQICNKASGQCQCKQGITGDKCDGSGSGTFVPLMDTLVYQPASGDCQVTSDLWTSAKPFDGSGFAICDLSNDTVNVVFDDVTGGMVQVAVSWPYYVALRYTNISPYTITGTLTLSVTGDTSNSLSPLSKRINASIAPGCPLAREKTGEIHMSFSPGQSTAILSSDTKLEIEARCKYSIQLTLDSVQTNKRRKRATIPEKGIQIDSVVLFPSLSSKDNNLKLEALANSDDENATRQTYETCLRSIAVLTTRNQTLSSSECKELLFTVASDIYNGITDCGCDDNGASNPSQCSSLGGQCDCKRGVGGRSCDTCLPGYFNLTASGCDACDCYGPGSETSSCDVDSGQCPCKTNILTVSALTSGATEQERTATRTCSRCVANFFGLDSGNGCAACECNPSGSTLLQCNDDGQCPCKETVQDLKCNTCKDTFFNFGPTGCSACGCNEGGSTSLNCDQDTGNCTCKTNAVGDKCDTCSAGHFNLATYNPDGCQQCFCFAHGTNCTSASGFELSMVEVPDPSGYEALLGRRYTSYGRTLTFSLAADFNLDVSGQSLVTIEAANGNKIFHQAKNETVIPRDQLLQYHVHLFEHNWLLQTSNGSEPLTPSQVYSTLADISRVVFIANFQGQQIRVSLISLEIPGANEPTTEPVQFVESCTCTPESNVQGLSCELCAVGFQRPETVPASSYQTCVACNCNNRGLANPPECNEVTGTCLNCRNGTSGNNCENCTHFVTGDECDSCETNYWGLSEAGCKACDCSSPGSKSTVCNQESGQCDCADNVVGRTCDKCDENFHNLTATGCIECDACYSLLKVEIAELRTARDFLVANLSSIEERDMAFGDLEPFVERFRKANEETSKLISFLTSAGEAETEVNKNITDLRNSLDAIQPHLTTIEDSTLMEIEDELSKVEEFIETAKEQRQKLVVSATTANNKIGALETSSATLKSLADNLQTVLTFLQTLANASSSDRQLLEELTHLNTTAHTTNSLASVLLKRVREANEIQKNTTTRLLSLESEIIKLMAKVTETHASARNLAASSQETTTTAAKLQANLAEIQAFNIDFSGLKTRTENVKGATESLELALSKERTTFDNENAQFETTTQTVQDLTDQTNTVGNSAAQLVARASKAEQKMLVIQENVDFIFESAESARDILADFSAKAAEIESEAQVSLDQVSAVHEKSLKLINESQALSQALAALQQIASNTRQASEQALQTVQPKLTQIQGVSNKATELENRLDKTESGYDARATIINSARQNIVDPANATCQAVKDSIADFQTKLAAATVSADTALGTASSVTSRANKILTELRNLQRVDSVSVDRLLEDVRAAEQGLDADDVRVLVNGILGTKESQQADIERLTKQRDDVQAKVQRLQSLLQETRPANPD